MNQAEILEAVSFPVGLRELAYRRGTGVLGDVIYEPLPDRRAVVRLDTGAALSVVSKEYKLFPYRDAVEPLLEHIDKTGGRLIERSYGFRREPMRLEADGRRLWIETTFNRPVKVGNDLIQPRVVYGNSYDGTTSYRAIMGFFQIKCTNAGALVRPGRGMLGWGGGTFSRKHKGQDELPGNMLGDHLSSFLDGFEQQAKQLAAMGGSIVSLERASEIFTEAVGLRFSEKKIEKDGQETNAWELYARITNFLSFDFKGGQQPAERRAANSLAQILGSMK